MKKFDVEITETLQRKVSVEAASQEDAERMVTQAWNNQDYVLDSGDFTDVDFKTVGEHELAETRTMDVLLVQPNAYPKKISVGTELEDLQAMVGGDIEVTYPFEDEVAIILNEATPYISVRRAWRSVNNRPVISTELKTPAAKRDIPIPGKLVECLKEAKEKSKSEYVISDRNGNALAESQFVRVWKYIAVRSTEERCYYTYVNEQKIKHVVKPKLGEHQPNNPKLVYTMDFQVTPHQLRHTYITNLIYASVDPKTVQYLAGHENSKVTMDIYAKVKYNKPAQLHGVINRAIDTSKKD